MQAVPGSGQGLPQVQLAHALLVPLGQIHAHLVGFFQAFPLSVIHQGFLPQGENAAVKPQHKHLPGAAGQQLAQAAHLHAILLWGQG